MAKKPRGRSDVSKCSKCRHDFPTYEIEDDVAVTVRSRLDGKDVIFDFCGSSFLMSRQAAEYVVAVLARPGADPFQVAPQPVGYRHPWEREDGACDRCGAAFEMPGVFICQTVDCDNEWRCRKCRRGGHWDCQRRTCDCPEEGCGGDVADDEDGDQGEAQHDEDIGVADDAEGTA